MHNNSIIAGFMLAISLNACSQALNCDQGFQEYNVYLYKTPEQSFVFFKNLTIRPIGFTVEENPQFSDKIDKIFSSFFGRSIGVEASVCGRIDPADLPLSPYTQNLTIRQARIVRNMDVTDFIANYEKSLRMPTK